MPILGPRLPDHRYRYLVLAASWGLMFVGTGSVYLLVVALKPIALEFAWPRSIPSFAYSLLFFGAGFGTLLMGYWLDRSGMAKPAMVAAVMIGLGAMFTSGITGQWQLYVIYGGMMGFLGRGALYAPLTTNVTRWFEQRRGMAVGIVASGQALAGALWPPVFQYGIAQVGWRDTSFWYGLFALSTMVPLAFVFIRRYPIIVTKGGGSPGSGARAPGEPEPILPPRRLLTLLSVAIVGCCVAMSLPLTHLLSHASDLGYSAARGAEMLALMLIAASLAAFFGVGALTGRLGGLGALFVFSSIQAVTLAMLAFVDSLVGLYLVAVVYGFGYGGVLPCYPVIVREYFPVSIAGSRTAIVIFFASFGMAAGSGMGGVVFDIVGSYAPAFLIGVAFNIGNLAVIGYLVRRVRKVRRAAAAGSSAPVAAGS